MAHTDVTSSKDMNSCFIKFVLRPLLWIQTAMIATTWKLATSKDFQADDLPQMSSWVTGVAEAKINPFQFLWSVFVPISQRWMLCQYPKNVRRAPSAFLQPIGLHQVVAGLQLVCAATESGVLPSSTRCTAHLLDYLVALSGSGCLLRWMQHSS